MIQYTVLTYIFNDYEILREVETPSPYAEYLLITDNKNLKSDTWKVIYDKELEGLSVFEKCYFVRFNPYKYCKTDICIRIDGSMKLKKPLDSLVQCFDKGKYDIALIIHPSRNRIDEEYLTWGLLRNYEVSSIDKALTMLLNSNYDFSYKSLFQLGFCITRNKPSISDVNSMTLSLLLDLGKEEGIHRVDQTVFSYVLNTHNDGIKVMPLDDEILHSSYIQICQHNSLYEMPSAKIHIRPYMFNKRIKTIKPADISKAEENNPDNDKKKISGALDTLYFFIKNKEKHKIRQTFLVRNYVYYGYHVLYGKYKCLFSEEERNCLINQIKSDKAIDLGIKIKYVIRSIRGGR